MSVILFKTFFDANTAREFLQNGSNFKDSERFNFQVRWFKNEDEYVISDNMKLKIARYTSNRYMDMNNQNMNINYNNGFMGLNNQNWGNDFNNKNMINQNMMGVNPMMNGINMQMQHSKHAE